MENGVVYAENELKPVINDHVDELALRAQQIAYDKMINDRLAALRQAGEDFKLAVNDRVDRLMNQASERRPDQDDPHFDDKVKIYNEWLDQVTAGIRNVHSFFERIWTKLKELLDKIFRWIKDGVANLAEKISNAFRIVKITFSR
jgi:chromatin segregation and condensation protein Rec8/ScpA/Scc1 (kleisin family)